MLNVYNIAISILMYNYISNVNEICRLCVVGTW